ncbi:hypothetical protein Dsin_008346 [Dipteronia sinensis]|uniref:SWIM-type domain-containing protein n=1 Tax=Dipteronia sinensis TaxID=43782 RepID=A0AAE0ANC6_9ROSI|nr:hypothetical protein Dsin_008346 [Dipteronia sinensis]
MYSYRIEEFDCAMAELKETYRKVYDELLGAGVEKFSRVHSPKKRYFLMTTNIVELMNSCLIAVQKLPITKMSEFIRDLSQMWFYNRRTNAREMSTYLTTFADEHIKDRTDTVHMCKIHPIHFNTFKVDDKRKETTVDLNERSCSCRQWDLDELPYSHAMAVARFKGVSINALVSEFYTTGFLKHAYEMGVIPVPDPEYWDIPDAIRTRTVLPWQKKNLPGRPKKLSIPSGGEKRKLQSWLSFATSSFGLSPGCCRPRNRYLSSVLYEMGKKFVYVVFKGRRTYGFNSWPECHEHVDGFPGASYQKFNSTDEAYKAISSRSVHSSHSWPESSMNVEEKESSVNVEEKIQCVFLQTDGGILKSINFFCICSTIW